MSDLKIDMETWLLAENRNFRPCMMKITRTKYSLPQTTSKTSCNDVLVLYTRRLWETQSIFDFKQMLHIFLDICFCMNFMM